MDHVDSEKPNIPVVFFILHNEHMNTHKTHTVPHLRFMSRFLFIQVEDLFSPYGGVER